MVIKGYQGTDFLGQHKILTRTPGQFLWRCIIISVKKARDYIITGLHARF